jgi:DnaJ domain
MTDSEARFILGLPPTYSARALKQAYRRAAATNHPDRGGKAERMVLVNEAYEVLSSEPAVVGPGPGDPAWAAADTEAFRSEPAYTRLAPEHPLERYVRGAAGVLATSGWIAGMIDSVAAADPSTLRVWILLGLPFCYLLVLWPVRCLVRIGIHIYNFGLKVRDLIGPRDAEGTG